MKQKQIRCAIYDRVSTDIQVQSGLSLDTQKELLTEYAISHDYTIVDYYADEGLTARKKLQNRRDFMRLLEDIKADKIDLVLVTKLDRWFRNVRDYHNTQAILEEHHCNWKTILEDYDTSTADGQLKINIMLAVAQNESDRTSERIKVVFEHKKRNQEHLNGPIPYGYRVVDKKLQKDPQRALIVEDIFRQYFSCFSKRKTIYYTLDKYKENAPTRFQIDRMLTSEIYAGMRYGRDGYCEPYITPKQREIIRNTCASKTYSHSQEPYIFAQLMKCPSCQSTMTGFVKKQTLKDGRTSNYKRYRCSQKFQKIPHASPVISETVIEEYMLHHVETALHRKIYELKTMKKMEPPQDNTWKIKEEMERLNILFQKGRIEESYYDQQYDLLESKLSEENRKLKTVTLADYEPVKKKFSGDWKDLYNSLDVEHKKVFWKRSIRQIYIDESTRKICGFSFLI